jgi:hypothetical protein
MRNRHAVVLIGRAEICPRQFKKRPQSANAEDAFPEPCIFSFHLHTLGILPERYSSLAAGAGADSKMA